MENKLDDPAFCRVVISILMQHMVGIGVDISLSQEHLNGVAGLVLLEAQCPEGHLHLQLVTKDMADTVVIPSITH